MVSYAYFGTGKFGESVFGGSKSYYRALSIISDISKIFQENSYFGNLIKITTTTGSSGDVVSNSNISIPIDYIIIPLSNKQRELDTRGIIKPGDIIGVFKKDYEYDGSTYSVEEGDILETGSFIKYRIVSIRKSGIGNYPTHKVGVLRKTGE